MKIAKTRDEFSKCLPVISQLRPHLTEEDFLDAVSRMSEQHAYELVYAESEGEIVSVAGIRTAEWLHTGKYLEIEDFVTKEGYRSKGFGGVLFDQILDYAREKGCKQVRLVSGIQRESAHRFYLEKGMSYEAKYFSINL